MTKCTNPECGHYCKGGRVCFVCGSPMRMVEQRNYGMNAQSKRGFAKLKGAREKGAF